MDNIIVDRVYLAGYFQNRIGNWYVSQPLSVDHG